LPDPAAVATVWHWMISLASPVVSANLVFRLFATQKDKSRLRGGFFENWTGWKLTSAFGLIAA
jgi:hypothetical protein